MDGTFDQVAPLDRLTGFKEGLRFDLKSATDRWPLPVLNSLMALPRGGSALPQIHSGFVPNLPLIHPLLF